MNDATPACDGRYELFWALMDKPTSQYLAHEVAVSFCSKCPVRTECLLNPYDEYWGAAAQRIVAQIENLEKSAAA